MSEKSVVRKSGEGDAYWMLGGLYEVLLSSDDTNGASTVMQFTIPEGAGPPPHTHNCVEDVYIVDGTVKYHIGGELLDAGPGTLVHLPAGTLETFEPQGRVRLIATYMPGGIEKFFAEAGERAPRREVPPAPTSPPDVERLAAIGAKYGLELQAPPG
jgi:mannose-6-phosphate isomerase-like protein (cupin superfamily)